VTDGWPRTVGTALAILMQVVMVVMLAPMVPIMLDMFVSEALLRRAYAICAMLREFSGMRARRILGRPDGFVLFLRDFKPKDSNVFEYKPIIGAVRTFHHRDEYVFAGVTDDRTVKLSENVSTVESKLGLPILAVANPGDGPPANPEFAYLWLTNAAWERTVRQLMDLSVAIVVVYPFDGSWPDVFRAQDLPSALRRLARGPGGAPALQKEAGWILGDGALRTKTVASYAFMDGSPGVSSEWSRLSDFRSLESKAVRAFLQERCNVGRGAIGPQVRPTSV